MTNITHLLKRGRLFLPSITLLVSTACSRGFTASCRRPKSPLFYKRDWSLIESFEASSRAASARWSWLHMLPQLFSLTQDCQGVPW